VVGATDTSLTVNGENVLIGNAGAVFSTSGNIIGGNILTGGAVSATGNVTGNYILGNGASLTGVITSVANINNGTSNVTVVSSGGNVTVGVGGTSNVAVFDTTGLTVAGVVSVTGNVQSGNLRTAGLISATGSITGASVVGGVITGTSLSVTGEVTAASVAGGVITGTSTSVTGTQTAASTVGGVITGTSTSVSGGVNAASVVGGVITGTSTSVTGTTTAASVVGGVMTGSSVSVSGAVTGASIATAGTVSATGNVTSGNLLINGSAVITGNLQVQGTETIFNVANLTVNDKDIIVANNVTGGANVDGAGLQAGNPATATWFFNNATTSWQSNIAITPTANGLLNLGGPSNYWGTTYQNTASVSGNIVVGNILAEGIVSTTGNITGNYILGNGSQLTGLPATYGNLNVTTLLAAFGSNTISTTGSITSGNVTGGNLNTGAQVVATGNVTGGNINTAGVVRATGDVFGKEIWSTQSSGDEGGQVNLSIPAANTALTGQVTIDVYQNQLRFFQGNSARGAYIDLTQAAIGVGTNLLAGGGGTPGGSNTNVQFNDGGVFGGNASFTYDKVLNTVTAGTFAGTLGGLGQNFKVGDDAWIGDINAENTIGIKGQQNAANAYIVFGNSDATGKLGRAGTGPLTYAGAFTATGNVSGGNITTVGVVSATGNVSGNFFIGNGSALTGIVAGLTWTTQANTAPSSPKSGDFWYNSFNNVKYQYINDGDSSQWVDQSYPTSFSTLAVTGNITSGNLSVSTGTVTLGNIVNANGNGVGNIGSAGSYFNTVFAKATSAQYADLAEYYLSDAKYAPGAVVVFGGEFEITQSTQSHSTTVAGVISTNPSYLMNSSLQGKHVLAVALTGRVPCWVTGAVNKGDRLVTSKINGVATVLNNQLYEPGCIIGKALENYNSDTVGIIEIAVGRY
jgi:hypothetical protein